MYFLLKWSLNWQFEGRKVNDAGARNRVVVCKLCCGRGG